MPYVFSTLTCDQVYTLYKPQVSDVAPPIPEAQVFVRGGANLADKRIITPRGVMTQISDEEKAVLLKCPAFVDHMKGGYVTIDDKKAEADEVAADMEAKDASAPLTPAEFVAAGEQAPEAGKPAKRRGK